MPDSATRLASLHGGGRARRAGQRSGHGRRTRRRATPHGGPDRAPYGRPADRCGPSTAVVPRRRPGRPGQSTADLRRGWIRLAKSVCDHTAFPPGRSTRLASANTTPGSGSSSTTLWQTNAAALASRSGNGCDRSARTSNTPASVPVCHTLARGAGCRSIPISAVPGRRRRTAARVRRWPPTASRCCASRRAPQRGPADAGRSGRCPGAAGLSKPTADTNRTPAACRSTASTAQRSPPRSRLIDAHQHAAGNPGTDNSGTDEHPRSTWSPQWTNLEGRPTRVSAGQMPFDVARPKGLEPPTF